ncbi:MAG: GSCFA domain-containing protein [Pseudomonadota bacterium]
MPLEKLSAEDAYARASANRLRIYPKEASGRARLMPYARPSTQAGFTFDESASIFAAGSCFARNVEKSLRFSKFNVVSSPLIEVPGKTDDQASFYNKYTIHSILNEIRWATGATPHDAEALVIDGPKGKSYDLQISASITGTRDEMLAFRHAYNASFAGAADADVVIITLGLIECWYDASLGIYLNAAPPQPLIKAHPGRFEFHLLDYADVLQGLTQLHALLMENRSKPLKFLVTVSPVGLVATFREHDVLVANCYSKSVQRAAVEAFCATHDAHYFPSYEYVTLTDRKFAWADKDFRHVRAETVDRIMADVLKEYVGESAGQSLLDARGRATAHFENGEHALAVEIIEGHLARWGEEGDLMWLLARALREERRFADALAACRRVIALNSIFARSAGRAAIFTARQIGDDLAAEQLFDWYARNYPEDDLDQLRPNMTEDIPEGLDSDRDHARRLFGEDKFGEAIEAIETATERHGDDEELLWVLVRSLRAERRFEDALAAARRILLIGGNRCRSAGRAAINTARQIGDHAAVEELTEWYRGRFPEDEAI